MIIMLIRLHTNRAINRCALLEQKLYGLVMTELCSNMQR